MPSLFPAASTQRKSWKKSPVSLSFALKPIPGECPQTSPPPLSPLIEIPSTSAAESHVPLAQYRLGIERSTDEASWKIPVREGQEKSHVTCPLIQNKARATSSNNGKPDQEGNVAIVTAGNIPEELPTMPALEPLNAAMELQRAEMEFSWELYLAEMNAYPVSPEAFPHVSKSLANGLQEGQYLEYVYPLEGNKKAFWYIELLHAHSSDVFVRYLGLENQPAENFWLDLTKADVFPCGMCDRKVHMCRPPRVVCKHRAYLGDLLEKSRKGLPTVDSAALACRGRPLKDRFQVGLWLEVMDEVYIDSENMASAFWPAMIKRNIGGRLQLEYWTPAESHDSEDEPLSTWIFCTDPRLKEIGWCCTASDHFVYDYEFLGLHIKKEEAEGVIDFANCFKKQNPQGAVSGVTFPDYPTSTHFVKGNLVEFVHPRNHHQIVPAIIKEVNPEGGMMIEVLDLRNDNVREKIIRVRHGQSLDVLPMHWCKKNGVRLTRPPGWTAERGDFSWQKIVDENVGTLTSPKAFSHLNALPNQSFSRGQKLEVSNPSEPRDLCTATVVKVIAPLLWVHIDSYGQSSTFILPFDSTEMYPVGFYGSNADSPDSVEHPLKLPRLLMHGRRMATIRSRSQSQSPLKSPRVVENPPLSGNADPSVKSKEKAPDFITLYINPKCHCGPLISMKKLIALPKSIGPGPVQLVLQCLITSLIPCGTRPIRLLQLIQASGDTGPRSANWERVKIKAKIGGRRHMGMMDVVKNASQVADFLRNLCILYEACPNLITIEPTSGRCPEHCHQFTKPDLKHIPIRRKLVRTEETPVEVSMPETPSTPRLEEPRRLRSDGGGFTESDEERDSQVGVDDDTETVASSLLPSRTGSLEKEVVVAPVAPQKTSSANSSENGESPSKRVRKEEKSILSAPVISSEKLVSLLVNVPLLEEAVAAPSSPSVSDQQDHSGKENENIDGKGDSDGGSISGVDAAPEGALVDDTQYLLHFFKDPREWTVEEVHAFFTRHLPGSSTPDILKAENIDGDALLMMVASDFGYLNVDSADTMLVVSMIERLIFSLLLNQQRVPLYSSWK